MGAVNFTADDYWPLNTALFVTDFHGNSPRFAYYLLSALDFGRFNSGSAQASLNRNFLGGIEIRVPNVREQHRISSVLGALDDKIESNRRAACLLEETAHALFRARFVDFVGLSDRASAAAGTIPVGWKAGAVADIATVHRDFLTGPTELPYIGLDLMPRGSTVLSDWLTDDAPTGQAARFERGDILFGKLRPYFRKVGVAPLAGRCSTEILVLRPSRHEYFGVLLGHVASQRFIDHCDAVSRGTRMPRAEWKDASAFRVAIPPESTAGDFSAMVKTLYAHIITLTHESRTLRDIRNSLLPKLVFGVIRVPDTGDPEEVIGSQAEEIRA